MWARIFGAHARRHQRQSRSFAVSTDADGENRLWEILPAEKTDFAFISAGSTNAYTALAKLTPIPVMSYVETRRSTSGCRG